MLPERLRFNKVLYAFLHSTYWLILKSTFLPITYEGVANIPTEPAIIVANHQSSLDIPLVGTLVDSFPHIWTAKSEIGEESKVLGFIVPRIAVMIDIHSPQKSMRALVHLITIAQDKKQHIIIFPEGGRYVDGKIHDFFSGFAILAKRTGRAVVPVFIKNVDKVYPPKTFWATYIPITVSVGEPMFIRPEESEDEFKDRVHGWFIEKNIHIK